MNEQFVTYEQAKELKEIGFDEKCLAYYDTEGLIIERSFSNYDNLNSKFFPEHLTNNPKISAPLKQQVFEWTREIKTLKWPIGTWIAPYLSKEPRKFEAFIWRRGIDESLGVYPTHREAEQVLIDKIITTVRIHNAVLKVKNERKENSEKKN